MSNLSALDRLTSAALLAEAARLARGRSLEAAEALLSRLPALNDDTAAQLLLAKVRAQRGDPVRARVALERASAISPEDAAVQSASSTLRSGAVRRRQALLVSGVLAVTGTAAVLLARTSLVPHNPPIVTPPLSLARESATATVPDRATRMRELVDYAALAATVRGLPIDPQLRVEPTADEPKLQVRVMGSLPTQYLRERILRSLQAHRNVDIDTSGLVVDPRYIVRAGDTLEAIADRVYGDRTRWKSVWSSNHAAIPKPGKLAIGTVLTLPS